MDLTDAQLLYLRSELGSTIDESALQDLYDQLGNLPAVVLATVRTRLATLTASPASMTLPGVYSRDVSANIRALQAQETRLAAEIANVAGAQAQAAAAAQAALIPPGRLTRAGRR